MPVPVCFFAWCAMTDVARLRRSAKADDGPRRCSWHVKRGRKNEWGLVWRAYKVVNNEPRTVDGARMDETIERYSV